MVDSPARAWNRAIDGNSQGSFANPPPPPWRQMGHERLPKGISFRLRAHGRRMFGCPRRALLDGEAAHKDVLVLVT